MRPCACNYTDQCRLCFLWATNPEYQKLWKETTFDEMPYYLINLKRRPDRLEKALKQFERVGIKPTIIEAVDGELLPEKEGFVAGQGALGCRDSHIHVLRTALTNKQTKIAVFEDDVEFKDNFSLGDMNALISQIPYNADAFFLGGQHMEPPITTSNPSILRCQNTHRTHAYLLLNSDYIRHLYNVFLNCENHIDHCWGDHNIKQFKVFAPKDWVCLQGAGKSDINGRVLEKREWKPRLIKQHTPEEACGTCGGGGARRRGRK